MTYVRIVPDLYERRRRLETTARSGDHWAARNEADFAAVADWFSGLSDDEALELTRLLERLVGDLPGPTPWAEP